VAKGRRAASRAPESSCRKVGDVIFSIMGNESGGKVSGKSERV
jgi:hypothetical protein